MGVRTLSDGSQPSPEIGKFGKGSVPQLHASPVCAATLTPLHVPRVSPRPRACGLGAHHESLPLDLKIPIGLFHWDQLHPVESGNIPCSARRYTGKHNWRRQQPPSDHAPLKCWYRHLRITITKEGKDEERRRRGPCRVVQFTRPAQ